MGYYIYSNNKSRTSISLTLRLSNLLHGFQWVNLSPLTELRSVTLTSRVRKLVYKIPCKMKYLISKSTISICILGNGNSSEREYK